MTWMTVTMVIGALGLALDYAAQRRLDEGTVQRIHDRVEGLVFGLQEQVRRIDAAFTGQRRHAERLDALEAPPDE